MTVLCQVFAGLPSSFNALEPTSQKECESAGQEDAACTGQASSLAAEGSAIELGAATEPAHWRYETEEEGEDGLEDMPQEWAERDGKIAADSTPA